MMQSFVPGAVTPSLEARAINLWRGEQHLLRNVSFALGQGELLQVVGPNGIGKSSLLRVIAGLLPAESGKVCWQGRDMLPQWEIFCSQLAYLGHANALKSDLTAFENLYFSIRLIRDVDMSACLEALREFGVGACAELPARVLSAGQRRRVAMARVQLSRTTLWVLDEPVTNLDATGTALVERMMAAHLTGGGMILAAAHQTLLSGHAATRSLALN